MDEVMRIKAHNLTKQKLFDVSREHYMDLAPEIKRDRPNPMMYATRLVKETAYPLRTYSAPPIVIIHKGFYDYNSKEDGSPQMWTSFANKSLGGGFLGGGYVQEEIITLEFYEMAMGIVDQKIPVMAKDEAYIFTDLAKTSVSDPRYYGKMTAAVLKKADVIKFAHFLSIDAPRRSAYDDVYTYDQLNHICVKTYTGFSACVDMGHKEIHTGNLGAGVFRNRRDVMYFLQFISAWLSGINTMHMWAYTDDGVSGIMKLIETAEDIKTFYVEGMALLKLGDYSMGSLYDEPSTSKRIEYTSRIKRMGIATDEELRQLESITTNKTIMANIGRGETWDMNKLKELRQQERDDDKGNQSYRMYFSWILLIKYKGIETVQGYVALHPLKGIAGLNGLQIRTLVGTSGMGYGTAAGDHVTDLLPELGPAHIYSIIDVTNKKSMNMREKHPKWLFIKNVDIYKKPHAVFEYICC